MTPQLRVRPEAEQDIEEAADWYEQQRSGLGNDFLDEVMRTFSKISAQPALYPTLHRDTHRALTLRFPFGVFYRVQDSKVVVIAVLHGSRSPRRWKQRT
jgi:plasmid stabilization system protein ParE